MRHLCLFIVIITSLFSHNSLLAHGKPNSEIDFAVAKVTDNIHMLMGVNGFTGGNIAILTGEDGVIMIDDSMPPLADKLKAAIKQVTDQPVDFLINTHIHGDHTGNNALFGESGTWIVGHENLRKHFLEKGVAGKDGNVPAPKAALPVITFPDQMNFHLNNMTAKIIHQARAHTSGDAFIHYQEANVIHTGDILFNELFPYIDIASGGSIDGFIDAQKYILSLADDKTKIIPGHGKLANKTDLQASIDMLEDSKSIIGALKKQGLTEDQVVEKNPLQKYHDVWNWGFITTERMTRQMYKGLK